MSAHYVRVFCTGDKIPAPVEIVHFIRTKGIKLEIGPDSEIDFASTGWTSLNFRLKNKEIFFQAELSRTEFGFDGELAGEIQDFIAAINDTVRDSQGKKRVLQHLAATKFYVVVPISPDLEDEGMQAVACFLQYFTTFCGGLIQDDTEGFFEGKKLLLKFEWKS